MGEAAGVGRPCLVGSSPYLFVHPAQRRAVRRRRRRGFGGRIWGVTVEKARGVVKFEIENFEAEWMLPGA
jgi:hypothetical protein